MSQEQPSATSTPMTDGYNACLAGHGICECPYEDGTDARADWVEGWESGKEGYVIGARTCK